MTFVPCNCLSTRIPHPKLIISEARSGEQLFSDMNLEMLHSPFQPEDLVSSICRHGMLRSPAGKIIYTSDLRHVNVSGIHYVAKPIKRHGINYIPGWCIILNINGEFVSFEARFFDAVKVKTS